MNRCIQLAKNGLGSTYPNPMVGCVLVYEDRIIGEGWHREAGLPHAEVEAIQSVSDKKLLSKATLYVSLEPCSHHGKTPPCSDLIIAHEIPKVVVGCKDPNSLVAGKGIERLKAAGIEVLEDVLKPECEMLNKRFFTFHLKKRPYVFLKWAESTDGFIAPLKKKENKPVWITNAQSRQWVHKLRAQEQAILIGAHTLKMDTPSLTTRDWSGKDPLRLIIGRVPVPIETIPLATEIKTVVFCENPIAPKAAVTYVGVNFSESIPKQVCDYLYKHEIQSLIVEGGRTTLQSFIDEKLWDEAFVFSGNMVLQEGMESPMIHGTQIHEKSFGEDVLKTFKNPEN